MHAAVRLSKLKHPHADFVRYFKCNSTADAVPLSIAQLGLNHLADQTHEEFKANRLGYRADLKPKKQLGTALFRYESASLPEHVDWVKDGAVTKVKNQQQVRQRPILAVFVLSLCSHNDLPYCPV